MCSGSSSDDEESLFQLSKVELCAKLKSLKRKLTDTMKENSRLRQSLVMLQGKVRGSTFEGEESLKVMKNLICKRPLASV